MIDRIDALRAEAQSAIDASTTTAALEDVRVRFLGRKAELPNLLRGVARPVDGRVVHVHSRSGSPCHRCGTTIVRGLAGVAPMERPMFYCPVCQPEPHRER